MITYDEVKHNDDIKIYIKKADEALLALGYTEHSFAHVTRVSYMAEYLLSALGYDKREIELAKIAGYMHDIGNMINRVDHAHTGATLAFTLLKERGFPPEDIVLIVSAIGNHDETTGNPVTPITAALILADKSDVRRSRVRSADYSENDIHDRVNYAVTESNLKLDLKSKEAILKLSVDVSVSPVMEYFEIFLGRMLMCKRAASYLGLQFRVIINEQKIL